MANEQQLRKIFKKTDGRCHLCHQQLVFTNYGISLLTGSWNIEHSQPRAKGGTDHLNNLLSACISCNCKKGTSSSRIARSVHGNTRASYSRAKKEQIRRDNISAGMFFGGAVGLLGGPVGFIIGAAIGGMIGHENSPNV